MWHGSPTASPPALSHGPPCPQVFDFSASPPTTTSRSLAIGADLPVAMGCCATCGVDRMGAAEVDELISMFKKFDRNGDGSIDGSELKALLHVSGADASDAQVATMLADNDTDGDGVISFSEFVGIVRAGEASEAAHAGAAGGGRGGGGGAAGGCVESSVTVGGNTLSCSHYVQLGYTCEVSACRPATWHRRPPDPATAGAHDDPAVHVPVRLPLLLPRRKLGSAEGTRRQTVQHQRAGRCLR